MGEFVHIQILDEKQRRKHRDKKKRRLRASLCVDPSSFVPVFLALFFIENLNTMKRRRMHPSLLRIHAYSAGCTEQRTAFLPFGAVVCAFPACSGRENGAIARPTRLNRVHPGQLFLTDIPGYCRITSVTTQAHALCPVVAVQATNCTASASGGYFFLH